MSSIDPKHIERAREVDLAELVRSHGIDLNPAGAELSGLCPFHGESTPSFFVNTTKGVYHCHGCGAAGDGVTFLQQFVGFSFQEAVRELASCVSPAKLSICAVASRPVSALETALVAPIPLDAPPVPVALSLQQGGQWVTLNAAVTWTYRDADGEALFHVQRFEVTDTKKTIRPVTLWRSLARGGVIWQRKSYPSPRPLYGLDVLARRPTAKVLVCEGEKAAEAAGRLLSNAGVDDQVIATTWPGGVNGLAHVDLEPLRGRKVVLWPDADGPGAQAADDLAHRLKGIATEVKRLDLPAGLQAGWDAADAEQDKNFDLRAFAKNARLVWAASVGSEMSLPNMLMEPLQQLQSTAQDTEFVSPSAIEAVENSEDDLALQLVERATNLRWSPGLGWMVDNGVVWARDEAMLRFDLARRVCRAAAAACEPKFPSDAKRLSAAKTVVAVLALSQADRRIVVPSGAWDSDPLLLNTPAGIVDLRSGTLRSRGSEYMTQVTAVAPDCAAGCTTWLRFLTQVFGGDDAMIEFMQRSMGYWLSGSTREQVIHFLYGQGSNGKSVLSDLVKWILGSYAIKLPAAALMQAKGERHPTELAQLRGRRLAMSSELGENDYFNEALLKELSGDATLTARFMRGDFFEFPLTQKHLIVGNFKPRLRGGDPAIARRMLLVPFTATFSGAEKDMHLPAKLKVEAPGILAWMIKGAAKWHANGLAVPDSVRTASAEYMAVMDDMKLWMSERCTMDGEARAKDLYADFSTWKRARGENAPSQTLWGERMVAQPGISRRSSNGVKYTGIQLVDSSGSGAWVPGAQHAGFGSSSYAQIRGG